MRSLMLLLFFAFGTVFANPISKQVQRIVGGSATTVERYPFMVFMQYYFPIQGAWGLGCGASLLTTRAILSAAHCFDGTVASSWRARVGTSFSSTGGAIREITSIKNHEGWSSRTYENDVAILKLQSPVTISANVGVARLPGPFWDIPDDTQVTAIGWGRLYSGGPFPEKLQHVDFNVINQETCVQRYKYLQTLPECQIFVCPDVTDVMLCTGVLDVGGKDACQGDSGGPVVFEGDIVVGVTSWGQGCADAFYPGVNARVSKFSNWISVNAAQV